VTVALLIAAGAAHPPILSAADPLKSLSKKLADDMKINPPQSLAVLNFTYARGRMSTGSHLVSERLVTYLAQEGMPLIERRLIQSLLAERRLCETGLVDPGTLKKMETLLGVDAVVIGTLNDASDTMTEVLARVIRVDTARILASAGTTIPRLWMDLPRLPRLAQARAPVPFMPPQFSMTTDDAKGRHRLADFEPRTRPLRYRPAPMPLYTPAMSIKFKGDRLR
jgi:hypothetical protein